MVRKRIKLFRSLKFLSLTMSNIFQSDIAMMRAVLALARLHNSGGRVSTVCIAKKSGKIVGIGKNSYLKSGISKNPDFLHVGIHAELDAISSLDLEGATLYIAGVTSAGNITCSAPCFRCSKILRNSLVKTIVYLDNAGKIRKVRRRNLEEGCRPKYNLERS